MNPSLKLKGTHTFSTPEGDAHSWKSLKGTHTFSTPEGDAYLSAADQVTENVHESGSPAGRSAGKVSVPFTAGEGVRPLQGLQGGAA